MASGASKATVLEDSRSQPDSLSGTHTSMGAEGRTHGEDAVMATTKSDVWHRLAGEMRLPVEMTLRVSGGRDAWLQRCHDLLEATPHFADVRVDEDAFEVSARIHRLLMRGTLTVTLTSDGSNATKMEATATMPALPNLFTLLGRPQRRILEYFRRAVGRGEDDHSMYAEGPGARFEGSIGREANEGVVDRGRPLAGISLTATMLVLSLISAVMVVSWIINGAGSAYYLLSVPALWALVFLLRSGRPKR